MAVQRPPMSDIPRYDSNFSTSNELPSITSPQRPSLQPGSIAGRINQLREVFQSKPTFNSHLSARARRRENSQSGFGRRKSSRFAGPALRNSRHDEQPDSDGTHSYLGPPTIARTNHMQEHATTSKTTKTSKTSNWEKSTGLHGQLQPMGIEYQANQPIKQWAVPLEKKYRPTVRRKYDRNGNLIQDGLNGSDAGLRNIILQTPSEHKHISKSPSLSTVLESQLLERKDEPPVKPVQENANETPQQSQSPHKEELQNTYVSSSHQSMINETPLSTKRKSVREMYDYYGIQRPLELCSDYGTHQAAQLIRVQRNCHVCSWINGPDTRCWKCLHPFCEKCDDISPKIFFPTEDHTLGENLATGANPTRLTLLNLEDPFQDSKRQKSSDGESSFTLQYPCINVPEPTPPSLPRDIKTRPTYLRQSPGRKRTPRLGSSRQVRTSRNSPTPMLQRGVSKVISSQPQGDKLQGHFKSTPARTLETNSLTYQPRPVYTQDIPKKSRLPVKTQQVSQPLQRESAIPSVRELERTPLYPLQPSKILAVPQSTTMSQAKQLHGNLKQYDVPNFEASKNLPTENPHPKKAEELIDSQYTRLRSTDATLLRNGSHRHRRMRRHTSGSESKSSSSKDLVSCESPGCRATHNGHRPYRHSVSCSRRRSRFKKETDDSGYIASRSYNDDHRARIPTESSLDLRHVEQEERLQTTEKQQNWRNSLKVPRNRSSKKKVTECVQCYGYFNNCHCDTCESIHQVMTEPEKCPPQTTDVCSGETQVFMPQPQKRVPSLSKLDPLQPSSIGRQTLRDTSNTNSAFDEPFIAPAVEVENNSCKDTEKDAGHVMPKVAHEKVKGDALGKPIQLGYEPLPKVPLYSVSYTTEETSALASSLAALIPKRKEESPPVAQPPGFSDLPTPVTEKTTQESFFAPMNQQLLEGLTKLNDSQTPSASVQLNANSNETGGLGRAWKATTASPLLKTKPGFKADSRKDFETLRDFESLNNSKELNFNQVMASELNPKAMDATMLQQPLQENNEKKDLTNAKVLAKMKTPERSEKESDKTAQFILDFWPSRPRPAETSSPRKTNSTPVSLSLSEILERQTIPLLEQKIQQQQYELERITKLLNDHFAEISSQPSRGVSIPQSISTIKRAIPTEETKEEEAKEENEGERTVVPWRLSLFDKEGGSKSGGATSTLQDHGLVECDADKSLFGRELVTEPDIETKNMTESAKGEDMVDRKTPTPTPKIVVREPTLILTNLVEDTLLKNKIEENNIKTPQEAFSPILFPYDIRKNSLEKKDTQEGITEIQKNETERERSSSGVGEVEKTCTPCGCDILGVTVVIHLEGGADKVVRAELKAGS